MSITHILRAFSIIFEKKNSALDKINSWHPPSGDALVANNIETECAVHVVSKRPVTALANPSAGQ